MKKITEKFPGKKILIADDYAINSELLKEMLELMECLVDIAEDGQKALEAHNQNAYDLIFMDIQMPKLDGYDATKQIRISENGSKRTPIVAITANALSGDREKCIDAGMDDYVSKPIKGENIEIILKKYFK